MAFSSRDYTKRFQVADQMVMHENPLPAPGIAAPEFAGVSSIQANCIGNLVYLIPWANIPSGISFVPQGYIYSYDINTKTFSDYTLIPDCSVTWGLEVVGTDLYVASASSSASLPAIFKSADGGNTWTSFIFSGAPNTVVVIRAMKFNPFNSQKGIAFGIENATGFNPNGWCSITADGGITWSAWIQIPGVKGVYDIAYVNDHTIIICGTNSSNVGITVMSTDGGITWGSQLAFSGTALCTSMSWLDASVGYIAARTNTSAASPIGVGRLYITTDGGINWSLLATMPSNMRSAVRVYAFSRSLIVVNGYDSVVTRCVLNVTRDGGLSWEQVAGVDRSSSNCQYFARKDNSLFSAGRGRILLELKIAG